jgi:hypothetical protein
MAEDSIIAANLWQRCSLLTTFGRNDLRWSVCATKVAERNKKRQQPVAYAVSLPNRDREGVGACHALLPSRDREGVGACRSSERTSSGAPNRVI